MADFDEVIAKFFAAQDHLVVQASDASLSNMVERKNVDLSPVFQRRERWNPIKQSRLIESFLLNIPVPPVYLAEDDLGSFQVIDGKQRLGAVHQFLTGALALRGLEDFTGLNGLRFEEMPVALQSALEMRPLRAVTLLRQSREDLRYEVFQRLNTGGESLNDQEIRNVVYRGPLNDEIYELAHHAFLRDRLKITGTTSSAYRQMSDAEYVLRFLTLSQSWRDFSGSLRDSMNAFMLSYREAPSDTITDFRRRFTETLEACAAIWGDHAFHRPEGLGWRDQTLAGMYDAQMLAVFELPTSAVEHLIRRRGEVIRITRALFQDRSFESSVREGTNTPSRIEYRTSMMFEALSALSR